MPPDCHSGINGAPGVAPDGTVYVPKASCDGIRIAVSRDAGETWEVHDVNDVGMYGGRPGGGDGPLAQSVPYAANPAAVVRAAERIPGPVSRTASVMAAACVRPAAMPSRNRAATWTT